MTEWDFTNFIFEKNMAGSIWRPGFDVAGRRGDQKYFSFKIYSALGWQTILLHS
jgi:hypothetical protein